jgi:hypothetical protein
MKITVELSDQDLKDVIRLSGEKKKSPAIRKFIVTELMLKRRREMSEKVMSGEWQVELSTWEEMRKLDRANVWTR